MSASDFVYCLQSQVGYREKQNNANLDKFRAINDGNGNYTKYGKWMGLLPSEWCDELVSWAGEESGNADAIGKFAYVPAHIQWFKDQGRFFYRGEKKPEPGDVIFFEYGYDGVIDGDHVGGVESCDGNYVHTIEGNVKDMAGIGCVKRCTYSVNDSNIHGYGRPNFSGGDKPEKELVIYPYPWKTYRNGSTDETVYKDTGFTTPTGSLNPYEECYCCGRYGDAWCILYKLDGTADDWAVGYVRYDGGLG